MFIKQIIIQGFKSYKEQTVIEPFSPKTNVIVGRNGSGKSNFFAAIRFVLADLYTTMSREERGALLHEGSGSAVMSAYVEVIFDNSDRRFPNEKDTLVLRRTIGYKKDEFSLDKKNAEKQEVMNMLETAGFSRSNPYYIVPQGRVTAITNMKDAQRLAMLKEVAGTQIYEDRRTESLKIMQDTSNKREKIDETLTYIAERLDELEEEKNELREYQTKDKDRRCLEYAFFDREQTIINEKLAEIEDLRQTGTDTLEDKLETLQRGEEIVLDHASEIKKLTQKIEALKRSRAQLEEDRRSMASMKAKVELDVKNLIDGKASREKAQVNHQAQLKQVKAAIAAANAELATIIPEFTKRQVNESEMQAKLEASKAALERLQNKQGRNQNFKSKGERDKALQKQIEQSLVNQGEQKEVLMDATEQVSALQKNAQALEAELQMIEKRLEAWPAQLKTLADKEALAHTKHESLLDQRRHLWREEKDLEEQERSLKDDYHRAKKELSNMMDGNTARGLEAVRRLKLQEDIPGAYGTIADLMEVPDEYRIAVEQVGGNSLFHYVVENADVATQLVNHLQQVQGGRLTFMPLAQIRKRNVKLPNAVDAVPLLQKVKFDPKFEAAFSQIFGKTIICESLAIAGSYSRSHGCDAVTLEGDKTSDKGALTGGYIDRKRSRLRAVQIMNKLAGEHEAAAARLSAIRKQIEQNDQETTSAQGELQKARYAVQQFDDARERLPRELRGKRQEHQTILALLRDVTKQRENADQAMRKVMDDVAALQVELASDFKKTLSSSEERQLVELETTIRQLQQDRDKLSEKRRELGKRKATIEIDIQQNLQPKLDSLNTQDMDTSTASSSGDLKASQGELRRITQVASEVEDKLQENEAQFDEAQTIIQVIQQEKAEKEQQLEELAQNIEKHQRRMNKSVAKRTALQERATECQKVIRDLGVLPEEAFTKYQNAESKTIENRLRKVNEALKKFKHVNKKAFEQYQSFTEQRETLKKRRQELNDALSSIENLIEVLDQRKDEKIERTFKQVSREFATIFERLVPAGRGSLKIQRRTDPVEVEEDAGDRAGIESYTGVGISVSFNSKHDEQQRIQQLSGGQKSWYPSPGSPTWIDRLYAYAVYACSANFLPGLCALALIFAIQQCDPAPFYLFDEIDANLDAQYRTAVAQMLAEISTRQSEIDQDDAAAIEEGGMSGQFICTTFRPEMILVADKCYGVTFHNKTSGIDTVSREEALSFVDGEAPR